MHEHSAAVSSFDRLSHLAPVQLQGGACALEDVPPGISAADLGRGRGLDVLAHKPLEALAARWGGQAASVLVEAMRDHPAKQWASRERDVVLRVAVTLSGRRGRGGYARPARAGAGRASAPGTGRARARTCAERTSCSRNGDCGSDAPPDKKTASTRRSPLDGSWCTKCSSAAARLRSRVCSAGACAWNWTSA